jgi:hypothetical protein
MRRLHQIATYLLAGCFSCAAAFGAAPPTSQPATVVMKVYITEVKGLVQVREDDTLPWRTAVTQMVVTEGAEFRTGPHSSVTCVIPPDQTFTLDRLGTVRVEEAAKHGDKITTDLIMKYGRTRYDIEAAGLEHEAAIVSPSSTLAVRGTHVSLYDQPPFTPEATSFTGRAAFTYGLATVPIGQKQGSTVHVDAGADGASETAVNETIVDPKYGPALTPTDSALISTEVARGAVISYDPIANIQVVTGGRPSYNSELPGNLPGTLDFVLRWTGDADLNIEVGVDKGDPLTNISEGFEQGEFLYPGYGYQNSPSGGHIPYDDRGGPKGGEEIAYWSGTYPTGLYGIAAQSISGPATSFTFNVYANGVAQYMYYFNSSGTALVKSTQVTQELQPGQNATALVLLPPVAVLEQKIPDDPNPNPGITAASFTNESPGILKRSTSVQTPSGPVLATSTPTHR